MWIAVINVRFDYISICFTNSLCWPVVIRRVLKSASHSETGMTFDFSVITQCSISKGLSFLLATSSSRTLYLELHPPQSCHLQQESKETAWSFKWEIQHTYNIWNIITNVWNYISHNRGKQRDLCYMTEEEARLKSNVVCSNTSSNISCLKCHFLIEGRLS